jgi:hypothetical protein
MNTVYHLDGSLEEGGCRLVEQVEVYADSDLVRLAIRPRFLPTDSRGLCPISRDLRGYDPMPAAIELLGRDTSRICTRSR